MTKHQLVAHLVCAPIQVEAISKLICYRVAPHGERDPNAGVYLCLAPIGGELVVLDYATLHAHLDGKDVKLSYRETERIAARLRRLFALGELPTTATLQARGPRALIWSSRIVWFIVFTEDTYTMDALYEDGRRFRQRAGYVESLFLVSDTLDIGYGELTMEVGSR